MTKAKNARHIKQKVQPKKTESRLATFDPYKWWKDRKTIFMLVFLLIITFIVMSPSLKGKLLNWDDDVNITRNENVKQLSGENLKNIFTQPVIGNYNPLTILTFALEYHFFGENPFYYHLNNLILHLINAFFVLWLMMLLRLRREWALFAAIMFAIHPMRVESVAWITERKDVLYAMFYLASVISYIYHLKLKKKRFLVFTVLFFLLSLLSKIQAVTLPLTLLLVDYILGRPLKFRLILEKIPYFILSLVVGLVGIYFLGQQKSLDTIDYTIIERLLMGSYALCMYVVKSVFPFSLSAIYPFPEPGNFGIIYYVAPIILICLAVLVYFASRRGKAVLFGTLFFLVNIVFMLQVVSAGQGFIADRFSYIPYIGLVYLYAYGASWLTEKRKKMMPLIACVAVVIVGYYAVSSWKRTKIWKDTITLMNDVIEKYPSSVAHLNRGYEYRLKKEFEKAITDYSKAISLKPDFAKAYHNRGTAYFYTNRDSLAILDFNKAISYDPTYAETWGNRGSAKARSGHYQAALEDFNKAIQLDPAFPDNYSNRGLTYEMLGNYEAAIADYYQYLKIKPDDAKAYNVIGIDKQKLKKYKESLEDFDKAISMDPQGLYYLSRSYSWNALGEKSKALSDVQTAIKSGTQVDPAYLKMLQQ